ncbi:MAG TPA: hypothetical protein VFT82_03925 [Candidatus Paceibacterota bacterium]|nr:hypothetical protein [Candidatus Paceibacterota bacterium]
MDRIVIVTKPTRFERLIREHLTEGAAAFVLESRGQSIDQYRVEHVVYEAALAAIRRQIPNDMPVTEVNRENLPNFLFRDSDFIIVCGPDGLFVNLAKYVGSQPVLTVNPNPESVAGILMLFAPGEVGAVIARVQEGKHRTEKLPFVKASIDDDRVVWGVNDIFIGRRDHVSARYGISFSGMGERHSSSGIIVSTGVGSTGWIRSVATMVKRIAPGSRENFLDSLPGPTDDTLVFVVREPFASPDTGTRIVAGRITPGVPLVVTSEMPDGGCIFSDGVVEKAIDWEAGSTVTVTVGDRFVERIIR